MILLMINVFNFGKDSYSFYFEEKKFRCIHSSDSKTNEKKNQKYRF